MANNGERQTREELERLATAAVPMVGLTLSSNGRVYVEGRGTFALESVVVEVDRVALLTVAAQLSLGAVQALERHGRIVE